MTDHSYPHDGSPADWQSNALQLLAIGQWEEALTLWVKQAAPHTLSLWLLGCLRTSGQQTCAPLLEEIQHWYARPEEKLRWQIFHHAEILGFDTPAGALALSLFWSQGSMSPEGLEPVYPAPHLSAQMLRCVLLMLATQNTDSPLEGTGHLFTQWIHQEKA